MKQERLVYRLLIREVERQAERRVLNRVLDGFLYGVVIAALVSLLIGQFSPLALLSAGLGTSFFASIKDDKNAKREN